MAKTIVRESQLTGDILIVDKHGFIASYIKNVWATGNAFAKDVEEKMPVIVDQNHINKILKDAHQAIDALAPSLP